MFHCNTVHLITITVLSQGRAKTIEGADQVKFAFSPANSLSSVIGDELFLITSMACALAVVATPCLCYFQRILHFQKKKTLFIQYSNYTFFLYTTIKRK